MDIPALPDEISDDVGEVVTLGVALLITDESSYEHACAFVAQRIQPGIRRIKEFFAPLKQSAHETHKRLTRAEADALKPYDELKQQVDADATHWRRQQQQERERQQRLERETALAQAEAHRTEQAVALADAGDVEAATELLAAPIIPIVVPSTAPVVPNVSGVVPMKRWKGSVTDFAEFLTWILGDPATRLQHVLDNKGQPLYNEQLLDKLATAQRKGFAVPGCVAREVESTTFRSR